MDSPEEAMHDLLSNEGPKKSGEIWSCRWHGGRPHLQVESQFEVYSSSGRGLIRARCPLSFVAQLYLTCRMYWSWSQLVFLGAHTLSCWDSKPVRNLYVREIHGQCTARAPAVAERWKFWARGGGVLGMVYITTLELLYCSGTAGWGNIAWE